MRQTAFDAAFAVQPPALPNGAPPAAARQLEALFVSVASDAAVAK